MGKIKSNINKPLYLALSAVFSVVALALVAQSYYSLQSGFSLNSPAIYEGSPTGSPSNTPTDSAKNNVTIKIKFAGVNSKPVNSSTQNIKVYATSNDGGPNLASASQPLTIAVAPDDQGVYTASFSLPETSCYHDSTGDHCLSDYLNKHYRLRVKGPKHKQIVFDNIPVVKTSAGIIIDLTANPLPAGDINNDGVVDATDLGLVKTFNTDQSQVVQGDLNFDGVVDITDKQLILKTLAKNFDEE